MPLIILAPTYASRTTTTKPTKVAPSGVTASQFEEERILTGTPSGSATHSKGASGSVEASGFRSVEASGSEETSVSASSDEADSDDSTPAPQTGVPAPDVD